MKKFKKMKTIPVAPEALGELLRVELNTIPLETGIHLIFIFLRMEKY